jgi:short-subunit dehydrogenase
MHVAITGASSGIGEGLVRKYLARNASVTLVARRRELLEKLVVGQAHAHMAIVDLSKPELATSWVDEAEQRLGPIDVLINNAGQQIVEAFVGTSWERAERMLLLDLHTPLRLSQYVARRMVERRRGCIVDIASMAALAPTPGMAFYNAAKAGLAAASESLRHELRPFGVHVVTVYPGPVATDLEVAGRAAYEQTLATKYLMQTGTVEELARLIIRAVEEERPRVIYPAYFVLARHLPGPTRWLLDLVTPRLKALP